MKITRKQLKQLIKKEVMSERKNLEQYLSQNFTEIESNKYAILQQEALLARVADTEVEAFSRMHESTLKSLPDVPQWIKAFGASVRNLNFPVAASVKVIPKFNKYYKAPNYKGQPNFGTSAIEASGYIFNTESWNGIASLKMIGDKQGYINSVLSNNAWQGTKRGDIIEYAFSGLLLMFKRDATFVARTDIAPGKDIDSSEGVYFECKSSEDHTPTVTLGSTSVQDNPDKYVLFGTTQGTYIIRGDLLKTYLEINTIPESMQDMIDFETSLAKLLFSGKRFADAIKWDMTDAKTPNPVLDDINITIDAISTDPDLSFYLKKSLENSQRRSLLKNPQKRVWDKGDKTNVELFIAGTMKDYFDDNGLLKNSSTISYLAKNSLITHFSYLQRLFGFHATKEAYASPEFQTGLGQGSRGKPESSKEGTPKIGNIDTMKGTSPSDIAYQISYLLAIADSAASSDEGFSYALNFVDQNKRNLAEEHKNAIVDNCLMNPHVINEIMTLNVDEFKNILGQYYEVPFDGIDTLVASLGYDKSRGGDDYISGTPRSGTKRLNSRDFTILEKLGLVNDAKEELLLRLKSLSNEQKESLYSPHLDAEQMERYSESKLYESILHEILKHSK